MPQPSPTQHNPSYVEVGPPQPVAPVACLVSAGETLGHPKRLWCDLGSHTTPCALWHKVGMIAVLCPPVDTRRLFGPKRFTGPTTVRVRGLGPTMCFGSHTSQRHKPHQPLEALCLLRSFMA